MPKEGEACALKSIMLVLRKHVEGKGRFIKCTYRQLQLSY